ncbi:thioredoxin family protein [Polluticoccus soli]|uniref:thioredoxin family protein n=1 Tax=Polluticoccus soli TaxID=3034150 RepID=UPI0023E25C77|nr:thioredoxin family protein [Flavipsychrobacter sp. JY13-12]
MRYVLLILLAVVTMSLDDTTRLQQAKQVAKTEQRLILIHFTGSDWCGPCKKMHKRVFQSDSFNTFATKHLVMIEADFPKNKDLDGDIRKENKELARRYQKSQSYPYTVLLDADGKLLKTWKGYGGDYPTYYIEEMLPLVPRIEEPTPPTVKRSTLDSTVIADSVSVRR